MPHCISDVGVEATRETLEDYCERLFRSTAVEEKTDAVRAKLMESLEYFWSIR
jgi:hypothetical protein